MCKCASVQVCKYESRQVYKYAKKKICTCASVRASMKICYCEHFLWTKVFQLDHAWMWILRPSFGLTQKRTQVWPCSVQLVPQSSQNLFPKIKRGGKWECVLSLVWRTKSKILSFFEALPPVQYIGVSFSTTKGHA